ncbi:uncharacterized protein LOC114259467 [Camellia sinensis]|uniref:uncharacterized protein LOC114259467 n=1 Tax=Camellia sinensis TaxID=4442 RepID=UPI001036A2C9|nr:uncharacterized protein LOC114259467 [Camellia sinensis]
MADARRFQIYRAKRKAREIIARDLVEQYHRIRDYAATVIRKNSTSHILIITNPEKIEPTFEIMYFRLGAQKDRFLARCRPIIGLDGCHLKEIFGGQLLSAIGRDGNDNMYPITVVLIKIECKASWSWFLEELMSDIGSVEEMGWTFILDIQKGLVETFAELYSTADHRYCLRHIKKIEEADPKTVNRKTVVKWLRETDPVLWARSHFSPRSKCDILVNNLSGSFNSYILEARELPIISMFEWIIRKMMQMIQVKKAGMAKYNGEICPNIHDKLEKLKMESRNCFATWCGQLEFEVDHFQMRYIVDLSTRTCSCKRWDLSSLLWSHAISAIQINYEQPEAYAHEYYCESRYLDTYAFTIHPVPDMHEYEESGQKLNPPQAKKLAGRPKKLRNK